MRLYLFVTCKRFLIAVKTHFCADLSVTEEQSNRRFCCNCGVLCDNPILQDMCLRIEFGIGWIRCGGLSNL